MALIKRGHSIVNVSPPKKLTAAQRKKMDEAPVNYKLITRALSRKFRVVSAR